MPFYETVFMSRQELSEAQVKDLTDKFVKLIKDQGGKVTKIEQWGLRSLAYRVKKARKAHYTLIETDAPAAAVIEMERVMRIEEDVMRALTLRLDALTEGPSVIMDKSRDRDSDFAPRPDNRSEKEAA